MPRRINSRPEQEIQKLEQDSRHFSLAGKTDHFERVAREDFLLVDPRGNLRTKAEELRRRRNGETKFESIEVDEEQIRVFGNAAVITGRSKVRGRHRENRVDGTYRFTRVYVNDQGTWRIVSSHSTRVEP